MDRPDPRLAEDVVAAGALRLRRARPDDEAAIERAVQWILERVRVELRESSEEPAR